MVTDLKLLPVVTRQYTEIKDLSIGEMFVDRTMGQREIRETRLKELRDIWDANQSSLFIVAPRVGGKYAVIDGQHRLVVCREKGVVSHRCEIRHGLSREEEARLFLSHNSGLPVEKLDKFKARLIAGDKDACEIAKILQEFNVQIGSQKRSDSRNYGCVSSIEKIYRRGHLREVICIIEGSWGELGRIARARITVEGVGYFWRAYLGKVTLDQAVKKFKAKTRLTGMIQAARNSAAAAGTSQEYEFANLLRAAYNYNNKATNRLDLLRFL